MAVLALLIVTSAQAAIDVVGNVDVVADHLTKKQLIAIYLQKPVILKSGEHLIPFDQLSQSFAYPLFYQGLLKWDSSQISGYRSLLLNEDINPPVQLDGDAAALSKVMHTSKAIAYVDAKTVADATNKVKVLYKIETRVVDAKADFIADNSVNEITVSEGLPAKDAHLAAMKEVEALNASLPHGVRVPAKMTQPQKDAWGDLTDHFQLTRYKNSKAVKTYIHWFLSHKRVLNRMLINAKPYLYYVTQEVKERGMPGEFALLPMVESGYDPFAYSYAGATGLWQLMPGTAASAGLEFSWWYDARSDVVTSTQAALTFLSGLHKEFSNWLLAAAAYNSGGGTVSKAQERARSHGDKTDFWSLDLPQETQTYVPKLLALAAIISRPSYYGVHLPNIPNKPYFSGLHLKTQLDLQEAADLAEVPVSEVHYLNPGIRHWATAPSVAYMLYLPSSNVNIFTSNLQKMAGKTHISWAYHEVQPGETLEKISHNYHTSEALLEKVNNLRTGVVSPHEGLVVPLYLRKRYGGDETKDDGASQEKAPVPIAHVPQKEASKPAAVGAESLKDLMNDIYQ